MSKRTFSVLSVSAISMMALVAPGCVADSTGTDERTDEMVVLESSAQAPGHEHVMLTEQARAQIVSPKAERAAKTLTYYGGPVLTHVNVIPVYWNSSVAFKTNLDAFYGAVVQSSIYTSLLPQYSSIGTGTKGTSFTGTQTATSVTDSAVQSYLVSLMNAGSIPLPNANNYYPVHFPPGVTIKDSSGKSSCVTWCAYHGTFQVSAGGTVLNVNYGIIPDQGGGCAGGCGGNAQRVNNLTSVSSHELVEATTDPAVGLATTLASPLAWYNATYGEIGDICNAQQSTVTVGGTTYVVQTEWSNSKNLCTVN